MDPDKQKALNTAISTIKTELLDLDYLVKIEKNTSDVEKQKKEKIKKYITVLKLLILNSKK
ncbi:hypothetical protein ['Chrysanthemum coronarium' phytoplasma]|uniref:hypothetical protein n=1 Tax='Chrysanthemum coronarium' phytoplasma TaxID=1520703 RepID=UPI0003057D31|nr:hypothetical protein ['Chrysanthemum coronarium' phytoplasma]